MRQGGVSHLAAANLVPLSAMLGAQQDMACLVAARPALPLVLQAPHASVSHRLLQVCACLSAAFHT